MPAGIITNMSIYWATITTINVVITIASSMAIATCLCMAMYVFFSKIFSSFMNNWEKQRISPRAMPEMTSVNEKDRCEVSIVAATGPGGQESCVMKIMDKRLPQDAITVCNGVSVSIIRNKFEDKARIRAGNHPKIKLPMTIVGGSERGAHNIIEEPTDLKLLRSWQFTSGSKSVASPGRVFIIRSVLSGRVLTESDGEVSMMRMTFRDYRQEFNTSAHWICIEKRGWLQFINQYSGNVLGYEKHGYLVSLISSEPNWERFIIRHRPECGNFLRAYSGFCCVRGEVKGGKNKLVISRNGSDAAIAWHFVPIWSL